MQFSRARRLLSASTTYQGDPWMSVCTNISSLAREYSIHFVREYRSVAESFHRRIGSSMRFSNRRSCSSSLTENQYLMRMIPSSTRRRSKIGHLTEEPLVLLRRAEPQDALHAGAVVPAAIEERDLTGGRQLLDVPLEVPLRPLPLGGLRQGDHAGRPRVRVLRDPLDRAALAGRVPTLEHHDDPRAGRADPFLHLHELLLQPEQLFLVGLAPELGGPLTLLRVAHGSAV